MENERGWCQEQPRASWFAEGERERREQRLRSCQRDNDYHIFPCVAETGGICTNSDPGTSHGAVRSTCHASVRLIDAMNRTLLTRVGEHKGWVNSSVAVKRLVRVCGVCCISRTAVCVLVSLELRRLFLITLNKHSSEVETTSALNYHFTQMSDSLIWTMWRFGAHLSGLLWGKISYWATHLTWWAGPPRMEHSKCLTVVDIITSSLRG